MAFDTDHLDIAHNNECVCPYIIYLFHLLFIKQMPHIKEVLLTLLFHFGLDLVYEILLLLLIILLLQ